MTNKDISDRNKTACRTENNRIGSGLTSQEEYQVQTFKRNDWNETDKYYITNPC